MATQANTRVTLAAILGTVTTATSTVTNTFDALNKGIGMLNTTVNDAAFRQEKRSKIDRHLYVNNLIRDTAQQESEATLRSEEFLKSNPAAVKHYEASFNELTELLK